MPWGAKGFKPGPKTRRFDIIDGDLTIIGVTETLIDEKVNKFGLKDWIIERNELGL